MESPGQSTRPEFLCRPRRICSAGDLVTGDLVAAMLLSGVGLRPAPLRQRCLLVNLPDPICLQVLKRQLRMNRFARRPELLQQPSQRSLDFVKWKQPRSAGLQSPERQQNQQWFMRRTFLPAPPDIQLAELFEDRVSLRHWHAQSIRRSKLSL